MRTLTIRLPDSLVMEIERESQARHVSKSDVVRERLDHPGSPFLKEGGLRDILEASWTAKVRGQPRPFRSAKKQRLAEIIRGRELHR